MSNQQNEALLEKLFEEGLDMGLSEKKAEKYARDKFENLSEPDYKRYGGVPSKFKGFSKLPEGVQEKISPDLAKKYKTGGMSKAVMKKRGGTFKGTF